MMMQKMTVAQQQYMQNINSNLTANNSNMLGFNQAEMNGMSDIFSFFSQNISQECQDPFPQAFFSCDNLGKENIYTPPLEDGQYKIEKGDDPKYRASSKYRLSAEKQNELKNNLESERKKQDELIKQSIDNFTKQYTGK